MIIIIIARGLGMENSIKKERFVLLILNHENNSYLVISTPDLVLLF